MTYLSIWMAFSCLTSCNNEKGLDYKTCPYHTIIKSGEQKAYACFKMRRADGLQRFSIPMRVLNEYYASRMGENGYLQFFHIHIGSNTPLRDDAFYDFLHKQGYRPVPSYADIDSLFGRALAPQIIEATCLKSWGRHRLKESDADRRAYIRCRLFEMGIYTYQKEEDRILNPSIGLRQSPPIEIASDGTILI